MWAADLVGPISKKTGKVVGIDDIMVYFTFGLNIFRDFRCTVGGGKFSV